MGFFSKLVHALEVEHPEGLSTSQMMLINNDLLPVPPEQRKWKAWNYFTFWIADSFNINTFMIASSMVDAGLNWWQAWLAVWVGYIFSAVFLCLNARPGAVHHLIFPAYIRCSFGVFGGLWPVFNRAAMACIWYGVQAWIGGECVYCLLLAIWPSVRNVHNGIPSSGTDTMHFVSFFIFCLLSLIPIYFPLHTIRHLFTVKAFAAPAAGLGLFGWMVHSAGGGGPILHQPATVSGSTLGWAFVANLMSCIANMATLITNAVDFASRADKPSAVILPQLFALPFTFGMVSFFGIIISSSTKVIFGEFIWSPLDLMTKLLTTSTDHGTRAGVAFISMGFIIAQMGTNIAANSISAGCDLTALFPRFITIRRGGYVAALVGFVMCPWQLLKSSNSFTSYLSAYSVFLSSIAGVMVTHYYVVSKQRVKVNDLYQYNGSIYKYWHGFNLRAYTAYICGIAINVVGFAGACGDTVPLAATRIYELSFFTGFGVSGLIYVLCCKIWPITIPTPEENLDQTVYIESNYEVNAGSEGLGKEDPLDEIYGSDSKAF